MDKLEGEKITSILTTHKRVVIFYMYIIICITNKNIYKQGSYTCRVVSKMLQCGYVFNGCNT